MMRGVGRSSTFALFLLSALGIGVAPACMTTAELTGGGAQVVTIYNPPAGQCQMLGTVTGQGGGAFGGAWISNDDLINYAMNDMRNKAAAMGATHVQASPPQLGQADGTTTTASVVGTAYLCSGP
jgi:hypothetical protein